MNIYVYIISKKRLPAKTIKKKQYTDVVFVTHT